MKIIEQFEPSFNDSVTTQWSIKSMNFFLLLFSERKTGGDKRRKLTGLRQYTYTVTIYNNSNLL